MSLTFYRLKLDVFWSARWVAGKNEYEGDRYLRNVDNQRPCFSAHKSADELNPQHERSGKFKSTISSHTEKCHFCQHVSVWTAVVTELQERAKVRSYLHLPSAINVASDSSKLSTYTRFQTCGSTTWLYICCSLLTSISLCHTTHGIALFLHYYNFLFIFTISRSKLESLYFTAARTRQRVRLLCIHLER
jgi:hypothetical protein